MKKLSVFVLMVFLTTMTLFVSNVTATLIVSGDSNITNALTGSFGVSIDSGNQQFFTNILEGGGNVLVLDNLQSGSVGFSPGDINSFYNTIGGVSSSLVSGTITTGLLSGVDLFVSSLPQDPFSAGEIASFSDFLAGGNSIFFLGENSAFAAENSYINSTLAALGSSLQINNSIFDAGFHTATGSQIALDPLTVGVNTFTYAAPSQVSVTGGTSLFFGEEGQSFVAYEGGGAPVPEPGTMLLFGIGLLGVAGVSRRKNKRSKPYQP